MDIPAAESLRPYVNLLTSLQYPVATPNRTDSFHHTKHYTTGRLDLITIVAYIAVLAILRDVLRLWVFEPLARWRLLKHLDLKREAKAKASGSSIGYANGRVNGHANGYSNGHLNGNANGHTNGHSNGHSNGHANGHLNGHSNGNANGSGLRSSKPTKKQLRQVNRSVMRFAEQGWFVVYYTFAWSYGLYVHLNLPTELFNPEALWLDYPHIPIPGPVKFYYLCQTASYIHQVLVLNAEERRKDHWQMMAHHAITVALLFLSYYTNFTRVGCIIMLLMDWCDIFLPLAKMMRYVSVRQIYTDATFGFFMVTWLLTRHILFIFVVHSTITHLPIHIPFVVDRERGLYMTQKMHWVFCSMLMALEVLQGIWFFMICRVAWRVVTGAGAADERSDDEGDDDDNEQCSKSD